MTDESKIENTLIDKVVRKYRQALVTGGAGFIYRFS